MYICVVNLRALFLAILFLTSQFVAFGNKTESCQADFFLHGVVKKSSNEKDYSTKSIFAFEVEEESELEFLKKTFPDQSSFDLNSAFRFTLFNAQAQRYFTHCVSGFRHVRTFILIRSIRI